MNSTQDIGQLIEELSFELRFTIRIDNCKNSQLINTEMGKRLGKDYSGDVRDGDNNGTLGKTIHRNYQADEIVIRF